MKDEAIPTPPPNGTSPALTEVRRPGLWLLVILILGLALRWWNIDGDLQQDEYGPLYAVAERQGTVVEQTGQIQYYTATEENKLTPVPNLQEVRERSILPYGIENPHPFYHYLLYFIVKIFPIAAWSLRLPSLLAGLGCVAGIYLVCRRCIGAEVALVAALLTAVDPMQVTTSVLARPYALANFACVWSFFFFLMLRQSHRITVAAMAAVGYAVCMAFIAYMNPILLFVGVAHIGLVIYWFLAGAGERLPARESFDMGVWMKDSSEALAYTLRHNTPIVLPRALLWLGGCLVAGLLLLPEMGYIGQVQQFAHEHREFLRNFPSPSHLLKTFLFHNLTFLVALLVVSVAGYIIRRSTEGFATAGQGKTPPPEALTSSGAIIDEKTMRHANEKASLADLDEQATKHVTEKEPTSPAPPLPDNPDVLWMGRCWLFLPQVLPFVLSFAAGQPMFLGRYLSYTMLGGAVLLAHWATRDRSREIRLGLSAALALTLFLMGFTNIGATTGLTTRTGYAAYSQEIKKLDGIKDEKPPFWVDGDVILVRSGFLEADLLGSDVPVHTRERVKAAILSPYMIVPASEIRKPIIPLTYSNYRSEDVRTFAGQPALAEQSYDETLARQLRKYKRFWYRSLPQSGDEARFLACFLPWLADQIDSGLTVSRNRKRDDSLRSAEGKVLLLDGTKMLTTKRTLIMGQALDSVTFSTGGPPLAPCAQLATASALMNLDTTAVDERYFDVEKSLPPGKVVPGLEKSLPADFDPLILIRTWRTSKGGTKP